LLWEEERERENCLRATVRVGVDGESKEEVRMREKVKGTKEGVDLGTSGYSLARACCQQCKGEITRMSGS
jgi:hypothetical protein